MANPAPPSSAAALSVFSLSAWVISALTSVPDEALLSSAALPHQADMGLAGMTVTEERLESVDFSDSYATGIQAVIVAEDSEISEIADLNGKKIGVQLATTGDIYAKEDFGEVSVEAYNKGADAVMALKQGKVDACDFHVNAGNLIAFIKLVWRKSGIGRHCQDAFLCCRWISGNA